jgi:hypothetical protein
MISSLQRIPNRSKIYIVQLFAIRGGSVGLLVGNDTQELMKVRVNGHVTLPYFYAEQVET